MRFDRRQGLPRQRLPFKVSKKYKTCFWTFSFLLGVAVSSAPFFSGFVVKNDFVHVYFYLSIGACPLREKQEIFGSQY